MRVKIVADSACDLPRALLERYDISLLPMHIRIGGDEFLDGEETSPKEIFAYTKNNGDICGTTAVNLAEYAQCFERYSAEYDAVICVNISSAFSSCYQNAVTAAQDFPNVYVVDSRGLSAGEGLVALEAARLCETGLPPEEVYLRLLKIRDRVDSSFILSRLDYMKKGGRCGAVTAMGANLLQIKPCVRVRNGRMDVARKYRGALERVLGDYVRDILARYERPQLDEAIIVYPPTKRTALDAVRRALGEAGRFSKIWEADASCTIACHCGPDTVGVMFLPGEA